MPKKYIKFPITEIFQSIQGEGINIGTPTTFLRFAGCNLQCKNCDQPSAQDIKKGELLTVKEIKRKVKEDCFPLYQYCLTGGEPLYAIQQIAQQFKMQSIDMFNHCINGLIDKDPNWVNITIETNGTIYFNGFEKHSQILWSISPKLSSRLTNDQNLININVLQNFLEASLNLQFKFVVLPQHNEIKNVINFLQQLTQEVNPIIINNIPLIFQPYESRTSLGELELIEYVNRLKQLTDLILCYKYFRNKNVKILPQLHKIIGLK